MFENWFDPCPYNPNFDIDGLNVEWVGNVFVNPPYSNVTPWIKRAIDHHNKTGHTVVMLLKHDSSTKWFRLIHENGGHILMVAGRLKHQRKGCSSFPSILCVFQDRE